VKHIIIIAWGCVILLKESSLTVYYHLNIQIHIIYTLAMETKPTNANSNYVSGRLMGDSNNVRTAQSYYAEKRISVTNVGEGTAASTSRVSSTTSNIAGEPTPADTEKYVTISSSLYHRLLKNTTVRADGQQPVRTNDELDINDFCEQIENLTVALEAAEAENQQLRSAKSTDTNDGVISKLAKMVAERDQQIATLKAVTRDATKDVAVDREVKLLEQQISKLKNELAAEVAKRITIENKLVAIRSAFATSL
jgi:hypothetical protein